MSRSNKSADKSQIEKGHTSKKIQETAKSVIDNLLIRDTPVYREPVEWLCPLW